ncbi:MAG: 16S rRNA (uracil(1498)-N(3))-methyltransferase [bacterium]|nr:16S rRNA (uracil(1498)-N(3))-methyltransferase [bacterium]
MQPPIFYSPPENRDGDLIALPPGEARHASKVMRLAAGAIVIVIDGLGSACRGEIAASSARKTSVRVHSDLRDFGEATVRLTLAAGLSAASKFDSVVQRGTELGVKRFVPLITEKSKIRMDDPRRARSRVTRLRKVALAATKQCRRAYLPEIALPTTFADFLGEFDTDDTGLIFHPIRKAEALADVPLGNNLKRLTLLVGPEAGFSDDEVALAAEAGIRPVRLGERVLRTETAGPVAVALAMDRLGELR